MIQKFLMFILSLGTIGFVTLTIHRLTMDYNENGIYFDGEVTYSSDAILVFGLLASLFFILTIAISKTASSILKRPNKLTEKHDKRHV